MGLAVSRGRNGGFMGFFENLFKREAGKIINDAVNNVMQNATDAVSNTSTKDEKPCNGSVSEIRKRIEKAIAARPGYSIKKNVPLTNYIVPAKSCRKGTIDYIICNELGIEVGAILLITHPMQNTTWFHDLKDALDAQGIKSFHMYTSMHNKLSYINYKLDQIL